MANAIIHIDGSIVLHSLRVLSENIPSLEDDAPLLFMIRAGIQDHPVWAYGRLAVVTLSYVHVTRQTTGDLSGLLEVSLSGELVSAGQHSSVLAKSIQWHTGSAVRRVAEQMISQLTKGTLPLKSLGIRVPIAEQVPPTAVAEKARKIRNHR